MPSLTPRNNIVVQHYDPNALLGVDTVYEIADAEFNSDQSIHAAWDRLAAAHTEFRGLFAQQLRWKVQKIVRREGFSLGQYPCECVAKQIAQDWWDQYVAEGQK